MNPREFDTLVAYLHPYTVFQNRSSNTQIDPEKQIFLTLERFGTYSNNAALEELSEYSGFRKCIVSKCTKHVM